jgi:hypothetical protein
MGQVLNHCVQHVTTFKEEILKMSRFYEGETNGWAPLHSGVLTPGASQQVHYQ